MATGQRTLIKKLADLGREADELSEAKERLDAKRKEAAATAYRSGLSRTEICRRLIISEPTLSAWLKEMDVQMDRR